MVVVAAALIINIRLIFYSATMARHWRGTPRWWRFVAAYLLIDPSFAVGLDGYRRLGRDRAHAYYLGGAVLLWVSWLAAIGAGATVGAGLPAWLHLEFVTPLFLVGEAAPSSPVQRCAERSSPQPPSRCWHFRRRYSSA